MTPFASKVKKGYKVYIGLITMVQQVSTDM